MADFKIKSAAGTGNKTLIQGQDQSGSNYAIEIGDAGAATLHNATITAWTPPAETIIQTFQQVLTSPVTKATSASYQDMGLSKSITLTSSTNKVLISVDLNVGGGNDTYVHFKIQRNGTDLTVGDARDSCTRCMFMVNVDNEHGENRTYSAGTTFLDTPGATSVEYKLWGHCAGDFYLNRCKTGSDSNRGASISMITLQEIVV